MPALFSGRGRENRGSRNLAQPIIKTECLLRIQFEPGLFKNLMQGPLGDVFAMERDNNPPMQFRIEENHMAS